ncbi:MAG: efflux transporter outer membrane subunit [Ideonella sp.]|nr:efflux transporter outer membrane subunit [Ideonella sp.]
MSRGAAWAPMVVAASAAVLSGCYSMAPAYERPVAPVAANFPVGALPAKGTAAIDSAADLAWTQFFADARLKRLIELALANNRDLRIAVRSIEQARALVDARRADQLPTVNAGLSEARATKTGGGIGSSYSAGVLVTAYEADLFGRVRSLSEAAAAQWLATDEARKAVQISLVANVANTHLALLGDDELLGITQQTLASREDSLRLTRLKFDHGATSLLDLRQAESLLEAARATLAQATRQRALDENALVLLLGQPLPAELPAAQALTGQLAAAELPAGLPSDLLERRPDVRQAEQLLIGANANIGAARAAFFPRITLTGSLGSASSALDGLFRAGSFGWSIAPQLLQPIFDAGRNEANLKIAQAGRDIAAAQYERAVQSAFREVADALAGRATLGEQLAAQQAQLRAEQDRAQLTDLRYRNGASSYLEVLDAQRSLFATQQAVVQLQTQRVQNLVTLYRVLGGGWTASDGLR